MMTQTHPVWHIDYQSDRSIYYYSLINNQAKDWLLDSLNSESNSFSKIFTWFVIYCWYKPDLFCSIQIFTPIQFIKFNIQIQYQKLYCINFLLNNGFTNGRKTNKYQSIRIISLCHYQIQSSWLFEATSFLLILNKS